MRVRSHIYTQEFGGGLQGVDVHEGDLADIQDQLRQHLYLPGIRVQTGLSVASCFRKYGQYLDKFHPFSVLDQHAGQDLRLDGPIRQKRCHQQPACERGAAQADSSVAQAVRVRPEEGEAAGTVRAARGDGGLAGPAGGPQGRQP